MKTTQVMEWNIVFLKVTGSTVVEPHSAVLVGGEGSVEGETVQDAEAWGAPGVIFRPLPPETIDGEEVFAESVGVRTSRGVTVLAWRDLRLNRLFPNGTKPGDIVYAGYGGNFVRIAADGTVSIATTDDGTKDGKTIYAQVRRDGFEWAGPWGRVTLDIGGFHVLTHTGARIDMGGIGGLPAPLDQLGSYVTITGAIAKIAASLIALGPDGFAASPAARADGVLIAFNTVSLALEAIAVSLEALGNTGAATAIGAAVTALTTTASAGVPSTSTTVA